MVLDSVHIRDDEELNKPSNVVFQAYPWRFVVVVCFVFAGFANALILLTFSPISSNANKYWNEIGLVNINLFAVSFQICYIPGTALGIFISKTGQLKKILLAGGILTTVGCLIRWAGAYSYDHSSVSAKSSYAIVLLGTFIVALSQPFYLNLPAKIASAWFPVKERDLATTVCSLANPLGSAIGSLIPPFFVSSESDDTAVTGVANLLLVQCAVSVSSLLIILVFFSSEPPTPPSNTQSQKLINKEGFNPNSSKQLSLLMTNREYLKLFVSFSVALGNLNALAALLGQLPGGYSSSEFGITGFALILSGFLGAFITGLLLEKTKSYRPILKAVWISAVAAWILFLFSCRSGKFGFFVSAAVILGLALLPIIPATIVNAVECAYPVAEDLALGILYVGANTLAVAMTFIGQQILAVSDDSVGPNPLYPFALWSIATMAVGLAPMLAYQGKYLRLDEDLMALIIDDSDSRISS